jgi:hypothetical protein
MVLKTVGVETYTLSDLLHAEAFSLFPDSEDERSFYLCAAEAFDLPPKDCPSNRYTKARFWAEQIWKGWAEKYPQFNLDDPTHASIVKAAIVFELANFLISTNLEESPFIAKNPIVPGEFNSITSRSFWLKQPPTWESISTDVTEDIRALETLLKRDFSGISTKALSDHLAEAMLRWERAEKRQVFYFDGDRFCLLNIGTGRIDSFVQNKLIKNLIDLLHRVQDLKYDKAYNLMASLLNGFINPYAPASNGEFNPESVKTRFLQFRKNNAACGNYDHFLDTVLKRILAIPPAEPSTYAKVE